MRADARVRKPPRREGTDRIAVNRASWFPPLGPKTVLIGPAADPGQCHLKVTWHGPPTGSPHSHLGLASGCPSVA